MSKKIGSTVTDYHAWVLNELAEIAAPSETAAAAWVIGRWIELEESGYLERHGISFERYKEETGREREGKLLSMSSAKSEESG